jgi:hypothetical protein
MTGAGVGIPIVIVPEVGVGVGVGINVGVGLAAGDGFEVGADVGNAVGNEMGVVVGCEDGATEGGAVGFKMPTGLALPPLPPPHPASKETAMRNMAAETLRFSMPAKIFTRGPFAERPRRQARGYPSSKAKRNVCSESYPA